MKSIPAHVEDWLLMHPFVLKHFNQGIINNNQLAHHMKGDIESQTLTAVSSEAIQMALSRRSKLSRTEDGHEPEKFIGSTTTQTNLSIVEYKKANFKKAVALPLKMLDDTQEFYILSQGLWHACLIARSDVLNKLNLDQNLIESRQDDLCGITVRLRDGHEDVLGVCAHIISVVSGNGVNLEEVNSTKDEMTLVIQQKYLQNALAALV